MVMKRASVAELKARLSEFLAIAKRGEDVLVTERGRPIAKLTALAEPAASDAHWAELVRAGQMRPPAARLPKEFWKSPRSEDAAGDLLRAVLEEREAGR